MSIGKRIGFVVAALPLFLPAALSSAVPDTHDPIEPYALITRARAVVDELARRGRVDGPVQIEAGRDLGSTARADFDFVTGACRVRIDRAECRRAVYPIRQRCAFSSITSCRTASSIDVPGGMFRHAGLSGRDAVAPARRLRPARCPRRRRARGSSQPLPLAHETYADLRAAALLLEEGAHREVVGRIAAMRADAASTATTRRSGALRLLDLPPSALAGVRLEDRARADRRASSCRRESAPPSVRRRRLRCPSGS